MNTLIVSWLVASMAAIVDAKSLEAERKVEVHVYNYAELGPGMLTRAEQEAAGILERMGIKMEWRNCPLTEKELEQNTSCDLPAAPTRFVLRLLSNEMARRFPLRGEVFGFAALPLDRGFGVIFDVFADRAQEMAGDEEWHGLMEGYLIAHEMGHLLLGTATHSVVGIMRAQWRPRDLLQIKERRFSFLPEQEERIREQVRERMAIANNPSTPRRVGSEPGKTQHP